MKTVYQTPSAGKDVDIDGYLLPCEDNSETDESENGGHKINRVHINKNAPQTTAQDSKSLNERLKAAVKQKHRVNTMNTIMDMNNVGKIYIK